MSLYLNVNSYNSVLCHAIFSLICIVIQYPHNIYYVNVIHNIFITMYYSEMDLFHCSLQHCSHGTMFNLCTADSSHYNAVLL